MSGTLRRFIDLLSAQIGFLLERGKLNLDRIQELETFLAVPFRIFTSLFTRKERAGTEFKWPAVQPGIYHIAQESTRADCADFHGQYAARFHQSRAFPSVGQVASDRSQLLEIRLRRPNIFPCRATNLRNSSKPASLRRARRCREHDIGVAGVGRHELEDR